MLCLVVATGAAHAALPVDGPIWEDVIRAGGQGYDELIDAALTAAGEGNARHALELLREARETAPDRLRAPVTEAWLLTREGRFDEVLTGTAQFESAEDRSADGARILFFRAVALARTGRVTEAAATLETATRYRTNLAEAEIFYGNLAELYVAAGDVERGVLFYQQALNANPDYGLARLGLAVALERLGRTDESRRNVLRAVVRDPSVSFLDAPGVFFVVEGEDLVYRALVEAALGEHESARLRLQAYRDTPAGATAPDGMIERLEGQLSTTGLEVERVPLAGCIATQIAVSPNGDRIAAHCEYGGLRETEVSPQATWRSPTTDVDGTTYDYYSYTVVDLAYAPDGEAVRVLHNDGSVQVYDVTGDAPRLETTVHFDNFSVQPSRFLANGQRVLFVGSGAGGFQTDPWDTSPVTVHLSYPTQSMWFYQPSISDDESVLVSLDGTDVTVLAEPSWTETARIRLQPGASRFSPFALTGDGRHVVTAHDGGLITHSTADGLPSTMVSLNADAPEIQVDPYTGITTIESLGGRRFAVGTSGAVYLVSLPE